MSYTAQYLLFDTHTSNLLSSQWFLFIFWKENRKHNWKTLISLQRIMTWASVLITLFIYFPLFLIALRQPYRSPQLSTDFTPSSQILPPYFHPSACPLPFLSSLSPPLPHRLSLPRLLGIAFKTVGSVAYSNPTNTKTTSAHKISLSFSISVLHDKASMGLLKQHFR